MKAAAATKKARKAGESIASAEAVRAYRQQRWNPLRSLSPMSLTRALDAFEYGDLREFAMLAETIAERDDTLKSVKPKREQATSLRDWKIELDEDADPKAAEAHQKVLKDFWKNARTSNAYDRNEKGGLRLLIEQMMKSVSFLYAVHHTVWKPSPGKLRAEFEFVPLWFFENTTGTLRFIENGVGSVGTEMDPREWMVTKGDGLMIACAIGYLAKRATLQDWLAFSEKFSMPGIVGTTSAQKGSPEGLAMKAAVEAFGQDWAAVMYGVADPSKPPIHLIQPNGNPNAMPMPALVERVDRKFAALYRGADLSSMSSKDGEGTGASLQGGESDILDRRDCALISEKLQEIDRIVIAWHFGEGVEPLARIVVQAPTDQDFKNDITIDQGLEKLGVVQNPEAVADRYGREHDAKLAEEKAAKAAALAAAMPKAGEPGAKGGDPDRPSGLKSAHPEALPGEELNAAEEWRTIRGQRVKLSDLKEGKKPWTKGGPVGEAQLKERVGDRVKLPDGRSGKVVGYSESGSLRVQLDDGSTTSVAYDKAEPMGTAATNSALSEQIHELELQLAVQRARAGLAADMQPIGDALWSAYLMGDSAAFRAAIKKITKKLPDYLAGEELAAALGASETDALIEGLSDR